MKKIYFSGIAGSGVSAIAGFLAARGYTITGSDRAFDKDPSHPLKTALQSAGVAIVPQDGACLDDTFELAVFSTAVEPDRPDYARARELGIPVRTRPSYLAEITASFNTIAVSGTSGKSTASGMLAFVMQRLGLSPNFIGGARVKQFKSSSNTGSSLSGTSDYLVIEACESDGTIVNYRPLHSIILNLDFDHHAVSETSRMFETLIKNTSGKVIMNADDRNLASITPDEAVTFSIEKESMYRAGDIVYGPLGSDFTVRGVPFRLSLPGKHNLYNALGCVALLAETGVQLNAAAEVLPGFLGIDRRFDVYLNDGVRLVIDDYAHNPHKISSLMETMKKISGRTCYIFQPHGFAPTRMMKKEYIETFVRHLRDSDHLVLLPIFYAGGTAAKDISSHDLSEEIRARGKSCEVIERREEILRKRGDYQAFVVFGARDESLADLARQIAEAETAGTEGQPRRTSI